MTISKSNLIGATLCIAAAAVFHGLWTHRWSALAEQRHDVDLLTTLSEPLGDWEPGTILPPPKDIKFRTTTRKFVSARDGRTLIVSQISGAPVDVATHTPDVCYPGSGFTMQTDIRKETFSAGSNGETAACFTADFRKTTATGSETVRVRWMWTTQGKWEAPDYQRVHFSRASLLHKIYIVHPVSDEEDAANDPYKEFVTAFVTNVRVTDK